MKALDFLLLALVALVLFFALRRTVRKRGAGGCGCTGGCAGCTGSCADKNTKQ